MNKGKNVATPENISRPVFIVGPGRSGTTLLRSLLSAHSRITVTPETHVLARVRQCTTPLCTYEEVVQ